MHKLLNDNIGKKVLLFGNESIARGAIEAGVAFASTYPGTPSSEISVNLFQISQETELYFEYSANEKVAMEAAAGAANSGLKSLCIMKQVGLNVASDPLITLAYIGVKAGMVVINADDPAIFSSQNEQDNRYYGKIAGIPVIEPSSIDEARSMLVYAFEISERLNLPVIFRTTTRINHSTEIISLGEIKKINTAGKFVKDPFNQIAVPAVARKLHPRLLDAMKKAEELCETSIHNFIQGNEVDGEWGIICNGVSYNYIWDAVNELEIADKTAICRIGFSNPMPQQMITNFLAKRKKVLIVEEGEPVMEEAVRSIAQKAGIIIPINGKSEKLFSRLYEFDPEMVKEKIANYFKVSYKPAPLIDTSDLPNIPMRPPNMCPGCSHRATYYNVKKAAEGMDTILPGDIGCYGLGFLPPLSMGDFLICMGSSVGTACGFSKAVPDKKTISFIGDSTFFHSGMPGLANAVFNNHNFTLVIFDNDITAMTGYQPHPGTDMKRTGFEGFGRVSIENTVRGLGVPHVTVIRPYKVKSSIKAIKEALDFKGVSVVISRERCLRYAAGFQKSKKRTYYISDKCKNHRTCVNEIACPAFFIENEKVKIAPDMCAGCTLCAQICPENAILPVKK
jgi:indolepyruvate ferredoxin oxidoreductase alpha subunit